MQTALIWGAAGGIGRALIEILSKNGWRVLGIARDATALSGTAAEVYSADLARDADMAAAALWAAQQSDGVVHLWVYAAGDMLGKPLADTTPAEWDRILSANVTGAHLAVTHSLALVPAGGHLVFIGAYVDRIMLPKLGAYAASKAALDAYVTVLGKEVRDRRITNVRVGAVDTPLWRKAPFRLPKGAHTPADVAAAVLRAHTEGHRGNLDL
ncbi:SDR family NAD(P)-dependent oxidoreductase [Roseiflexus castenholzii]|jgi:NAD(P)-dependent dehydrogenase (short-subunit alcohol dehydrogenase family)|uniref:Short-chain dehydrogenase/reductase SDR n=1 Tax=Roseiflexus castenholzii (strain DSM 13941 / HLO8) TaxID=383372 RepID=A7NL21_ROSCS|nr:SDR family NAD(P)-dependent oxidoreductase [Roseiflexus castenholzii]ABU58191.1 short-chain dehydrogenase/reductase SDR [Roseiflexus castenholzii DSM 13941]